MYDSCSHRSGIPSIQIQKSRGTLCQMHVFQNTLHVILQDDTDTRASILLSQETS